MNTRLISLIFNTKIGNPIQKLILLELASFSDDSGVSGETSISLLASETGVSRKVVTKHIQQLMDNGFLSVINGERSKVYKINIEKIIKEVRV